MTSEQAVIALLSTMAQVSGGILAVVFAFQVAFVPQYDARKWAVIISMGHQIGVDPQKPWQADLQRATSAGNRQLAEALVRQYYRTLPSDVESAVQPLIGELAAIDADRRLTARVLLGIAAFGLLAIVMNAALIPFSYLIADDGTMILWCVGVVTVAAWAVQAIVFYAYLRHA